MGRPVTAFIARLLAGWLCGLAILISFPGIERSAQTAMVWTLATIIEGLGFDVAVSGTVIAVAGTQVDVVGPCTPMLPTTALWSAILAFPASASRKLAGAAVGATILWIYNCLRALALIGLLAWGSPWFGFAHLYLWQPLTIVVVWALFVCWVRLGPREAPA